MTAGLAVFLALGAAAIAYVVWCWRRDADAHKREVEADKITDELEAAKEEILAEDKTPEEIAAEWEEHHR